MRNEPMKKQVDQTRQSATALASSPTFATVKPRSFSSISPTAEPGPLAHRVGEIAIMPPASAQAPAIQARRTEAPTEKTRGETELEPAKPAGPKVPQPVLPQRAGPAAVQPHAGDAFSLPSSFFPKPRGSGQPLPEPIQKKTESFFKTSFADVRVHVGQEAPSIGALAFTQGADLYFGPGQYNPQSTLGQQLLGHELTHVVQQRAGRVRNPLGGGAAVVQDPALEAEAERMGLRAATAAVPNQATPARTGPIVAHSQASISRPTAVAANGAILPERSLSHVSVQREAEPILPEELSTPRKMAPAGFSVRGVVQPKGSKSSYKGFPCNFLTLELAGSGENYLIRDPRENKAFKPLRDKDFVHRRYKKLDNDTKDVATTYVIAGPNVDAWFETTKGAWDSGKRSIESNFELCKTLVKEWWKVWNDSFHKAGYLPVLRIKAHSRNAVTAGMVLNWVQSDTKYEAVYVEIVSFDPVPGPESLSFASDKRAIQAPRSYSEALRSTLVYSWGRTMD
jgi:Domain of unknown function (DUF4157)